VAGEMRFSVTEGKRRKEWAEDVGEVKGVGLSICLEEKGRGEEAKGRGGGER
jgi:hypothetical protein